MAWVRCCGGAPASKLTLDYVDSNNGTAVLTNNVINAAFNGLTLVGGGSATLITFTCTENANIALNSIVPTTPNTIFMIVYFGSTEVWRAQYQGNYNCVPGTYTVKLVNTSPYQYANQSGTYQITLV